MKVFFSALLIFLHLHAVQSQTNVDSLQRVLKSTKVDRDNLQKYVDQLQVMTADESKTIQVICEWLIKYSDTDSLRQVQATAHFILGKMYTNISRYEDATRHLTIAQTIAEKHNFYSIQADALNALGAIYGSNEQTANAINFYKKAILISTKINYLRGISRATYNLGNLQLNTKRENNGELRSAVNLMLHGFNIAKKLNDTLSIINQSRGLGNAYTMLQNYDSALAMLAYEEKLIKPTGKDFMYVRHYLQVAKLNYDRKKYPDAIKHYEAGLSLARKFNVPRWMCMYYTGMADTYEHMGNYKKANLYNQLNIRMHDALVSKENFAAAADIQNKYERAKKDNEILKLAAVNKQKSTLNAILLCSTFGVLLVSFLGYTYFKNRSKIARQQQELQSQKIVELEKDKQLVSLDAMLKGQEEERSRIAKDLHDGLGGLLSGTKLSLMNVRESLSLSKETATQFDKSLSLLDNTIGDLRKVAQNLVPEALVKFGLPDALRDFCDSIQASSGIKLLYHYFGEKRKLNNTAEVFIYRIIQELVNNAVKHADASEVIVQLTMNNNRIGITVEDNGNGFDKDILRHTKGAGMANVNYRAQYFNGIPDIVSSPGKGTSVSLELKA